MSGEGEGHDFYDVHDGGVDVIAMLATVLDVAPAEPPAERIVVLRARAEAARDAKARAEGRRRSWVLIAAAVTVGIVGGLGVARLLGGRVAGPTAAGVNEYAGTLAGATGRPTDATLTIVRTGIGRVVELDTEVLPILPSGEYYEVWFVERSGSTEKRISAGTFHPDTAGRSFVRFAAAVDPSQYPMVEVTAEPGDGDPAATGPVVLQTTIGG